MNKAELRKLESLAGRAKKLTEAIASAKRLKKWVKNHLKDRGIKTLRVGIDNSDYTRGGGRDYIYVNIPVDWFPDLFAMLDKGVADYENELKALKF